MATTIEERLTRLERKNRRLTLAMFSTGVAAILVVAVGMASTNLVPEKLKASGFELVDKSGKVRATLVLTEDGWPGLLLLDDNGKTRLELTLDDRRAGLDLCDDNGKVQAALSLTKKGPSLQLGSEERLRMFKNCLMFEGKDSKPRIFLAVDEDEPMLDLCSKGGKSAITMGMRKGLSQTDPELFKSITKGMKKGLSQGPFPEIVVYSPEENASYTKLDGNGLDLVYSYGPHACFHINENGSMLTMNKNPSGMPQAMLCADKDGPVLVLSDENGRVLQSLPSASRQPPALRMNEEYQHRPQGSSNISPSGKNLATQAAQVGPSKQASTEFKYTDLLGGYIVAHDGQSLGLISTDDVKSKSILNSVGDHGSDVSSNSIFNNVGEYGSDVSSISAFNDIASDPPRVYNKDGEFMGFLTVNKLKTPRIDPRALIGWLKAQK